MNGGQLFSGEELTFIASTYKVVVLSVCVGPLNISVTDAIFNVTAALKAINPSLKVMQYWNMQQFACYLRSDPEFAAFLNNPQWWLLDDSGAPVMNNGSPSYNWLSAQAVAHWLTIPLAPPGGAALIDGFLLDGGAVYDVEANISPARLEALKLAKWRAMGQLQARLTAANGGLVLGNGMAGGPIDPHVNDPFNLGVLDLVNGVENERGTPIFEYVDSSTGAFKLDMVAANLAAVEAASNLANGTKVVACVFGARAPPLAPFSPSPHAALFSSPPPLQHELLGRANHWLFKCQ